VTLGPIISPEQLLAAENSPLDEYRQCAQLYRHLYSVVEQPGLTAIIRGAGYGLLLPSRADFHGDPWIHLAAAMLREQTVASHLGRLKECQSFVKSEVGLSWQVLFR
jgi:hypothetical protein